jgi:acyl carrier protein
MLASPSRQRLSQRLVRVIEGSTPETIGELTDSTSLIRSGLVDSMRLLEVALFVEREIGCRVDLSKIDPERDWDTMRAILQFIDEIRAGGRAVHAS